jgi:pyridoxine 4-dehydrogenase
MQIPGPGVWGEPRDHDEVIRVLRRALELGVAFIDTADSYGPGVSERLIHEALYFYPDDLVIATKAGFTRPGPDRWERNGKPQHLRAQAERSLGLLGLERIELFQLHRIDPEVPLADQLGALVELQAEGKVGRIGLSEVSVSEIEAARAITPIATVQNRYNLADRSAEPVLHYCGAEESASSPGSRWPPAAWPPGRAAATDRRRARRQSRAARARVAVGALTGSAADPGHIDGRTPRRERRRGVDRAHF